MPRQDRLSADVERGFAALENGEFEEAAACLERCSRIDRKHPDVVTLAAALADAEGDTETALARYRELSLLRPDDPMPRVCVARLQLHDEGDPDAALETIEEAFEFIDDEEDLIAAVLVRTEALIAIGDLANAKESLDELSTSVIDDPQLALDLGELALATGDAKRALAWAEIA
jgi:tetratricopeptide (TPR) repeat protein